jgi:hypothetical protein
VDASSYYLPVFSPIVGKPIWTVLSRSAGRNAAVDKNKRKMGIDVIIKDNVREVLATLLAPKDHCT